MPAYAGENQAPASSLLISSRLVGLATDYCVRHTALDALRAGFDVAVDRAGVRGIDVEPGDVERALDGVRSAGGSVV